MVLAKPNKPTKIRGSNASMTINTKGWTKDAAGAALPTTSATETNVPIRINRLSPGQVYWMGHASDSSLYRVRCPVMMPDGSNITLTHDQTVTIDSVEYSVLGPGQPMGSSSFQHVIVRKQAH